MVRKPFYWSLTLLLCLAAFLCVLAAAGSTQAAVGIATGHGGNASAACREMQIYLQNYYGPVQRVKLNQAAGNIKHMYWYKKPGGIQRLNITYNNNQRQEVRLMWNPDSIRGYGFWCHQGNKCVQVPGLENQDYILNFMAHFNNQPTHVACSTYARGGYPGKVLFNNFNGNGVDINPTQRTFFRITGRCTITEVQTFHHNRYRGKVPGKIYIKGVNGTPGSWAFKARPGLSSWQNYYLPNANWIVNPANLTIGPGTYEITVSDKASWSHNPKSGNAGYAIVWGKCSAAPPAQDPWVSWRGHRYRVITTKVTWPQAHAQAQKMGGHLVVISDKAENEFVTNLAHAKGAGPIYWLGFTDLGSEGRWRWVTGQKITYTNWSVNEPNNYKGREHCGNVGWRTKYGWDDAPCDEKHGFVVEVDGQAAPPPAASKPTFIGQWHGWTQCTNPANGKKPFSFTVSKSGQSYVCDDHSGQNKFKPGYLTQSGQTTWLVCPWARSQGHRGVYYWRMDPKDPKLLHGREDVQGLTCKSYNYQVRKVK